MDNYEINIPDISFQNNFIIIYKGREEREGQFIEQLEEIQTSKELLLRKLRYFQNKTNEINQMNEIFIHDVYCISTFKAFINSIRNNKIDVNEHNYKSILELSRKYKYQELENEIYKFIQTRPDIELIINEQPHKTLDFSQEEKLSRHLDLCLRNDKLIEFPLPVLARILNNPMRVINDHHLLFEFIKKLINKYNNESQKQDEKNRENLEIILSSLDLVEMSNDDLDDFLNNEKYSSIFNCQHSKERMKIIHEENQTNRKKISDLESRVINLEKNNKVLRTSLDEILNKLSNQEKIYCKYKEENEQLQQMLHKQEAKIDELKNTILQQMNSKYQEEIQKLKEITDKHESKYQEEIQKLKEITDKHESKFNEIELSNNICGSITAEVESNQSITGTILIQCKENYLDKKRSKFIINTNNSIKLNEKDYANGKEINSLFQKFTFKKPSGTYYVHALIVNKMGISEELISGPLTTNGQQFTFDYTGKVQSVTLGEGTYKIEVWGAEGGQNDKNVDSGTYTGYAGKGGYSVGTLSLASETTLYVYVGGTSNNGTGGWNGGGAGLNGGAGGGGSTDVSLYGSVGSSEWNTSDHLYSRIIVAGGGGGSSHTTYPNWQGGNGGGTEGEQDGHGYEFVKGGKQTSGYEFSLGESNTKRHNAGGGGGWYGGYSCNNGSWGLGGGGGSGYVYNSSTASSYPSGCKLNNSFYLTNSSTTCGNSSFPNEAGTGTENGHRGNGFVKITTE